MDTPITIGILAGCAALVLILVLLSLHILRKESAYLRERSRNGEILLLTFDPIMALYRAAPEKWEMQVDGPLLSGMIGGKVAAGSQEPCAPPAPAETADTDSLGKSAAHTETSPSNQPPENG